MNTRILGSKYEEKASEFLRNEGFEILKKNLYSRVGELDLIAKNEKTYIFVEVKYRNNKNYGSGEEAIDIYKMRKIYKTAMNYLFKEGLEDVDIRFDAIIFFGEKIRWIKDIIWGDELGF